MPVYDYECPDCGVFTALRPMTQCDAPHDCPDCGASAPRVFLTMPALAMMDAGRRTAITVNERAQHEPKLSSQHGAGCSCCAPGKGLKRGRTAVGKNGAKSFPSARPWMISH